MEGSEVDEDEHNDARSAFVEGLAQSQGVVSVIAALMAGFAYSGLCTHVFQALVIYKLSRIELVQITFDEIASRTAFFSLLVLSFAAASMCSNACTVRRS